MTKPATFEEAYQRGLRDGESAQFQKHNARPLR